MATEFGLFGGAESERPERRPQRGNYGEWEYLRGYSTGTLTKLMETVAREFKARGLTLTYEARACKPGE
jgi:hypothetical protein